MRCFIIVCSIFTCPFALLSILQLQIRIVLLRPSAPFYFLDASLYLIVFIVVLLLDSSRRSLEVWVYPLMLNWSQLLPTCLLLYVSWTIGWKSSLNMCVDSGVTSYNAVLKPCCLLMLCVWPVTISSIQRFDWGQQSLKLLWTDFARFVKNKLSMIHHAQRLLCHFSWKSICIFCISLIFTSRRNMIDVIYIREHFLMDIRAPVAWSIWKHLLLYVWLYLVDRHI